MIGLFLFVLAGVLLLLGKWSPWLRGNPAAAQPAELGDRSPVDLVLTADEKYLLTANQTSSTVSLAETETGQVIAEVPCGKRPSAIALTRNTGKVLVTGTYSGDLTVLQLAEKKLTTLRTVHL